jgi:sulfate transport system substrate-binding protein
MLKPFLRGIAGAVAVAVPLSLVAATSPASGSTNSTVNVVGYSIVANAYSALESAFLLTPQGQGVTFKNSFGPSTTQAEDVVAGQPADVVNFSQVPDLKLLIGAGLVSNSWNAVPVSKLEGGMVTDSVVVIVVRPGNPLGITGWNSLTKKGVQIVTPDPISSGSARWNLLAAYESQISQKASPTAANSFLNSLIGNVVSEPSSGSKSLTAFLAGTGNVLLAYESDAAAALAAGKAVKIIDPAQNLLIENPASLTKSGTSNAAAGAFYKFLFSPAGQKIWETNKFRPTLPSLAKSVKADFYQPKQLVTIRSLGGWPKVTSRFFSTNGIVTAAEKAHGYTS